MSEEIMEREQVTLVTWVKDSGQTCHRTVTKTRPEKKAVKDGGKERKHYAPLAALPTQFRVRRKFLSMV